MTVELSINLGSIVAAAVVIVRYLRKINQKLSQIMQALENFPPHRHAPGGLVLYPADYQPPKTETLYDNGGNGMARGATRG